MPFLYNVHTPNKTFALAFKDGEQYEALINRIAKKASLSSDDAGALKGGKDGSGLVYEYEGGRWSLDDDDDLNIMHDRLPPSSTSSATLHLTPPHAHAHFAPPSYSSGALKNKSTKSGPNGVSGGKSTAASTAANTANNASSPLAQNVKEKEKEADKAKAHKGANGTSPTTMSVPTAPPISTSSTAASHHFPQASHSGNTQGPEVSALSKKVPGEKVQVVGHTEGADGGHSHRARLPMLAPPTEGGGGVGGGAGAGGRSVSGGRAPSVMSTMSRKSRYGNNDAEPLWETKKRAWLEFHNGTGVRTVMGKVGQIDNVRMLLKPGYKGVYVSRSFAIKAQLVDKKYAMGASGYTGLRTLGQVPITVAGRTSSHPAMISEEAHFDVVLGRSWIERMNVKIDPNDQTILTYMDSGESIPCDIVVLKDDKGNKIHIT